MMCEAVGLDHKALQSARSIPLEFSRNHYIVERGDKAKFGFWDDAVHEFWAIRSEHSYSTFEHATFKFFLTEKGKAALIDEIARRYPQFKIKHEQ